MKSVEYRWKGPFDSVDVERLHAEGFGHDPADHDWRQRVESHSLGWVCAYLDGGLVGFVNVAWDGAEHAFLLDTLVRSDLRRTGVATTLVGHAIEGARAGGCQWLHVDFEPELASFYIEACGFVPTPAGLVAL